MSLISGRATGWRKRSRAANSSSSAIARRANIEGYLFIAPWLLGLLLFQLGPMVASFILSFTSYDVLSSPIPIGFQNYKKLFTDDPLFWKSLGHTLYYVAGSVPIRLAVALLLAILLNQHFRGTRLFRTIFYMPSVTSGVAVATVWLWMYEPTYGVINTLLRRVGIPAPPWLGSLEWSMPAVIIMNFIYIGPIMVIFLAGLQGIPQHLYEAAVVDGAGTWRKFRHITLPMLSPTLFFNTVIAIISSFQVFTDVYVMTRGGPANATLVYVLYLYQQAFQYLHMGYASALAWVLFMIILIITVFQFKVSGWVYYEGGQGGGR